MIASMISLLLMSVSLLNEADAVSSTSIVQVEISIGVRNEFSKLNKALNRYYNTNGYSYTQNSQPSYYSGGYSSGGYSSGGCSGGGCSSSYSRPSSGYSSGTSYYR